MVDNENYGKYSETQIIVWTSHKPLCEGPYHGDELTWMEEVTTDGA